MSYSLTLPNGFVVENIPDNISRDEAMGMLEKKMPDAFPGIGEQLLRAPLEVGKGFIRGITTDPASGIASLAYTGARAGGADLVPFEQTQFGQTLGEAQSALAPGYGTIPQFFGGVGSLLSYIPGGLLKGGIGLATRLTQAGASGSEEARARAEESRVLGEADATAGEQFASQVLGTGTGFSELLPIQNLVRPVQAVLRGIPASQADAIAPGLFNSAKRMLTTGGFEGLQEGMANIAQDLIAKGIYNPDLEVGESALGDAAMGASVGAFAQGAIDLMTRGKRRSIYEQLKQEERDTEDQSRREALAQQEAEKLARAQEGLGFTEALKQRQEVLRLPAPAVEVDDVPGPDPLRNPLGNFTEGDLTPEVTRELNRRRKEAGLPTLKNFSIEDLADLDAPQAQINAFIANRLNQQGIDVGTELETQLAPRDVLGFAQSQGVDTSTVGFTDFLRRTTGADDLKKMSPVQRLATISALRQVPENTGILPQGTNATRFTDQQYNKAVDNVKKTFPDTDLLGRTSVIQEIKDFSGLTNDRDAESLLQTAIQRGDLTTISKPIFEVTKDGAVVRKYNTRKSAEEAASKLGFGASVREQTLTEIGLPGDLKSLPGGPDIRKGTFQEGTEPVGYDVRSDTGVLSTSRTLDEANKKADSYTAIRQRKADELQEQITKSQEQIDRSQSKLEEMEATGQAGTTAYAKAAAGIANNNKNLTAKIGRLNKERASLLDPVTVAARGQKPVTREGYTLFDGETPVGTFPNQQAAEQAAISRYDEDMLQRIADTGDRQRGLKPKRLAQLARDELVRRSGEGPQGFGVEITGTPEAAEQRLEQAGVFTRRAQDQINELQKKLLPALKKLGLESVGLRIVRSIQEGGADGFYAQRLITVALDATDPMGTLRHESIHALKELGAFKPNEWKILERRAKEEWIDRFLKDRKTADGRTLFDAYKAIYQQENGNLNGFDAYITEEAIADAFKYFNDNKAPAGLIANLMQRLKKFFDALENAFKGLGFQTADDVFTRADTGMLQPLKEEIAPGVRRSQLRTGQSEDIETTGDRRPFSIEQARIYERELENLVKRVGSRIAGMDSTKTLTDVKAAIKKLQRYASEGISGKEWYERSAKAVLDQFNGDPVLTEKFFQLIAITSAGTEVKANFTKASKAWEQFATGQAIKVGTGRENRAIDDLLNFGVDWDGRKTNTFYQNLMEAMLGTDTGRSTIDLHMARMLFDRDAPTDAQYGLAENMIRLLSTKTGLPARQIQAASWVTQKAKGIFQDYRRRGLKKAMTDAELRQHAFNMAITDYAHLIQARGTPPTVTDALREPSASIRTRVQTATGEVIPSVKGAMSQVAEMPYKDKESLNKAILNDGMVQSIAEALGIKSKIRVTTGKGGYEQSISPNLIVQVVNPNPQQAYQDSIDLTDAMSFVFQQDATPFFRADPALIDSGQIGFRLRFARPTLTDTQDRKIFRALIEELGPDAGFSKTRDNEYVVINYRDAETGEPFGLSDPEFMEAVARFRDKANQITEIEDATAFGADSEYRYNEWAEPSTGETLLAGIQDRRRDRSNLSGGLTNLRKSFVGKARDAVRATGVIPRFSLRPTELAGGPSPRGGIVLGESRQPNAASYTGIHYGKERVNSLAGAFYGTGIKGSEAKRLRESQDPRIKRRVYFYIPDTDLGGRMPKPEGGLGQHVYRQSFDNILPPGEEMTRLYNEAGRDSNAFESAVLDKGYDGYAIPSMGMMVVMDHNVPVNYLGDRDDVKGTVSVDGQLFSLRATDTPEFKQWFGKSQISTLRGYPRVMYHGTARDISEFRPKQANAIFVTENPKFAEGFTGTSETFMAREMFDNASPDQRNEWIREAVRRSVADGSINRATANNIESNLRSGEPVTYQTIPVEVEVDAIDVLLENLPSKANIMPLYVKSDNPFDYNNPEDVGYVVDYIEENHPGAEISGETDIEGIRSRLSAGSWIMIEHPLIQEAIRANRHDGFYVREGGQKNLAVYEPNQVKSAIGNIGTFSSNSKDIRFSLALGSLEPTTALIPDRGGNPNGNLGLMPDQFDGKPIRMLIGTHDDIKDKGYGANHILARVMADPRRAPAGPEELLDRIVRSAQDSSQRYTRIYQEGSRPILYDGNNVVILSPEKDQYSIITSYAMENPDQKYGKPVWQGRAPAVLPGEARGLQVEARLGRVAPKPVDVKAKRVYSSAEIARLAEEMPLAAFVEPVKKGTLSLKKKPEGKLSLRATDTPAFKRWFGDSKVVDKKGDPLVVYHGTAYDFSEFSPERLGSNTGAPSAKVGFFFTPRQKTAEYYAKGQFPSLESAAKAKRQIVNVYDTPTGEYQEGARVIDMKFSEEGTTPNIMPMYLSLQNPLVYDFKNKVYRDKKYRELIDQAKREGRDGVILQNTYDSGESSRFEAIIRGRFKGEDIYVAFEPTQIKSAIGNVGTYDPNIADIRYSLRSTTPPPEKIRKFFDQEERLDISPEVAEIREAWIGGVADSGLNDAAYFLHSVSGGRDHTKSVQKMAREMLGNRIKAFRLMSTEELENIRSGDLDYYASFTLNPSTALNFANFVKNRRIAPRDLIVVEADLNPGDIHMLGSPGETEVVADMSRLGGDLRKIQEFAKPVRFSVRTGIDPAIVGSIERTTTTRQEQGFGDRMAEAISPTSFTKFRAGFINTYERIEQNTIRRAAEQGRKLGKEFGDKELLAENSAIAAALMSDRASGIAAEAFKRGIPVYDKGYTFVDNKDGSVKGLMEILVPLAKTGDPFTYRAFQFYAAAKRGKRLDREGREQVFTKKEQLEAEALKNHFMDMDIDFDSIFNEYQKFNSGLVKYMVDTGVISKAMGEKWTENWDYIPFYRQLEGGVTPGPNVFQSLTGVAVPKKLKGGSAPLADFLETIVRNTRSAIEAGMNNIAAQRVIRDALELNDPANSAPYARKLGPGERLGSDVVTVREEGKDVHYQVTDPLLIQALKGLNMPQFPFLEILAKPAQLLRELVTKDPGFMMANLLRDSLQAWGTGQQITPLVDTFKQYGKVLANMSPEAQKLMRAGVGTGYEFKGDVEASTDEFAKQLRAMAGQRTTTETALLPLSKAWDALDRASTASDLATRAEVFKRVFEDTGSEAEAVFQAIEVMNFSRKGSNPIMQIAAASIPFLNARIQGLDLLYRAGFGKLADKNNAARQKAFFVRGATMVALSSLYWLMASETEEWKTAEPEARDNNWIIGPVRIPIPFELGVIFKVAPERTLEYFFGDDTSRDLKQSFVRNLTSTLGVNPIPQAVLPIFENYVNYSFFTGQPIVGRGLEDVSKPFQVNTSTSMFAKGAGETLGMSPVQIDNLIRGYTGTIGGYVVMAMDAIFRGEGDPTKAEMRAEQLPVIKRFFATPQGTGTMTAYYELKKAVDESVRTVNFLDRGGRVNEMAEYMQKHANLIAVTPYVRSLDKEVTMLRDMKRVVNNSQMDPEQKREALDAIRLAEVNMTRNIQQLKKLADR